MCQVGANDSNHNKNTGLGLSGGVGYIKLRSGHVFFLFKYFSLCFKLRLALFGFLAEAIAVLAS